MNDGYSKIIEKTPLIQFSIGTTIQVQSLRAIGNEIIELSKDWTDEINDFQRVYNLFWLWVLGAHEVIRTMDQHKECFAAHLQAEIGNEKKFLAEMNTTEMVEILTLFWFSLKHK